MFRPRLAMRALRTIFCGIGVLMMWPASQAHAFCGMYVSGASDKLYNDATQVVMMRGGTKTVLSMRNTYQGPPKDFAMVVPVPVILKKENVKVLKDELFQKIDTLSAPRLVEYWEQDPCPEITAESAHMGVTISRSARHLLHSGGIRAKSVKVEAKFKEGEYEIVVLSATESNALEQWLIQNKYNIPKGAASVLAGYVQKGMYFFVAKVDVTKVKFNKHNEAMLSPLRFHYDSDDFSLPVRLGLLNARGMQDLIIHILAQNQRYEVANAKNVTIPTNLIVDKSVKTAFAPFYAALFDYTLAQNPGAVVTEYAWQAAKCDPCPSGNFGGGQLGGPLDYNDLQMLGMEIVFPMRRHYSVSVSEGTHVTRGDEPPKMALLRQELSLQAQRCAYQHLTGRSKFATLKFNVEVSDVARKVKVSLPPNYGVSSANAQLYVCLRDYLERFDVSAVKAMVGGSNFTMISELSLSADARQQQQWQLSQGWVLTRLHARYDAKTLKHDLIFKTASPIVGGRGMPEGEEGRLHEQGAHLSSLNNFQARYAILYPWAGKMMCNPRARGRWGYPLRGPSGATPALGLEKISRDKVDLSAAIKSKNAPGLPWFKP